tara:strand:- start:100 stop:696 length:597 start_codon:yes stop_codon:yes gene_type:complete
MAENQEAQEELSSDETAELDELLDDDGVADKKAATGFKKILSNKIVLGGVLVLLIAIGVGVYFFIPEKKEEVAPSSEEQLEEIVDEEIPEIEKVYVYKLEPFFFPIRNNDKETGRFISVSANLLLSNRVLDKNIDKVLPILRNSIYTILQRKKPDEFTLQRAKTEEKLKKEILTASNALLLSGAGTITDVFFSNFMIK